MGQQSLPSEGDQVKVFAKRGGGGRFIVFEPNGFEIIKPNSKDEF